MKSSQIGSVVLLAAALWLFPCVQSQSADKSDPAITKSKALKLAKDEFVKTGRNIDDYRITIDGDTKRQKWVVWFDQKGRYRTPGGTHSVVVDKTTGKATFLQGK